MNRLKEPEASVDMRTIFSLGWYRRHLEDPIKKKKGDSKARKGGSWRQYKGGNESV